jgi:HlyD family secretion protein
MAKNGATADQLRQLQAKYKGLKEQYEFAQKSFKRASNMYRDSLMSPQAYDEVYAKLQGAKAQYDAVVAELDDVKRGTRFEKVEMAAVAYSERYIIATNDMEIETISLNTGELATAGFALFNGYIPGSTYFRFTVPESAIARYKKGQEVNMQVVYNKETLTGTVVYIKQLTRYADITTAYPDYQLQDAVYEIKVKPADVNKAKSILVNANVILK